MQMKLGRGKVCIRGYRVQQSISAAVSFAATRKLRSLVPLNRVYTVLTQARTGPPRRSESNEAAVFSVGWLWVAPPQNLAVQIAQVTSS
jgi:hypothetical protein